MKTIARSNVITPEFEKPPLQAQQPSTATPKTDLKPKQGGTDGADPLIPIAREMKRLNERYQQLDNSENHGSETDTAQIYRSAEMRDIWSKIIAMRDYCTTLQACSLEGAIVQLGVVHWVMSEVTENGCEVTPAISDTIERLMFSSQGALKACTSSRLDDLYIFQDMNNHQNPWVNYEDRIAKFNATASAQ